jgi:hypothetical protein
LGALFLSGMFIFLKYKQKDMIHDMAHSEKKIKIPCHYTVGCAQLQMQSSAFWCALETA